MQLNIQHLNISLKQIILIVNLIILLFVLTTCKPTPETVNKSNGKWVLVIHGGAGVMDKKDFPKSEITDYHQALTKALNGGAKILDKGGSALDAVEFVVRFLEDSPLFNAGKGAVFNAEGINELDAAIMDGSNLAAGAVAGLRTIKNPISAARAVMEKSEHVLLIGEGAEQFAYNQGLEKVPPHYFFTEKRWQQYLKAKKKDEETNQKMGTVGAVAMDAAGHLAAATSTGGRTYKKYGRVGDVPVIGAGTYANDSCCAVSATGHGEYFIRNVVAYDIAALMMYKKQTLATASEFVINEKLKKQGGDGGIIAVDKDGNFAMPFNTAGMFRGWINAGNKAHTYIFREE